MTLWAFRAAETEHVLVLALVINAFIRHVTPSGSNNWNEVLNAAVSDALRPRNGSGFGLGVLG